jgi:aspartate racemase
VTGSATAQTARLTVGVIGGMGPFATADFLSKLISATPADRDQDHLRILVDCNPQVPDRTQFLAGRGSDPRPVLRAMARGLVRAGADLLVMPCNTAHAFRDELRAAVTVPLVDWPAVAADAVAMTGVGSVGILASSGALLADIYQAPLRARGITSLAPPPAGQALVTRAIYGPEGVKRAGPASVAARADLLAAAAALIAQGAGALLLACTEFSALHASAPLDPRVPVIDAGKAVARHVVWLATRPRERDSGAAS